MHSLVPAPGPVRRHTVSRLPQQRILQPRGDGRVRGRELDGVLQARPVRGRVLPGGPGGPVQGDAAAGGVLPGEGVVEAADGVVHGDGVPGVVGLVVADVGAQRVRDRVGGRVRLGRDAAAHARAAAGHEDQPPRPPVQHRLRERRVVQPGVVRPAHLVPLHDQLAHLGREQLGARPGRDLVRPGVQQVVHVVEEADHGYGDRVVGRRRQQIAVRGYWEARVRTETDGDIHLSPRHDKDWSGHTGIRGVGPVFHILGEVVGQSREIITVLGIFWPLCLVRRTGGVSLVSFTYNLADLGTWVHTILLTGFWIATGMSGCPKYVLMASAAGGVNRLFTPS